MSFFIHTEADLDAAIARLVEADGRFGHVLSLTERPPLLNLELPAPRRRRAEFPCRLPHTNPLRTLVHRATKCWRCVASI